MAWQEQQPTCRVERHEPSTRGKAHTQAMPNLKKGWDAKNESPKSHVSFTPQELNEYQSV